MTKHRGSNLSAKHLILWLPSALKFKFSYGYGLANHKEAILNSKWFSVENKPSLIDFYILFHLYLEWDLILFLVVKK